MYIYLGKLFTAFNLTYGEAIDFIDSMSDEVKIEASRLILYPPDLRKYKGEPLVSFTPQLVLDYATDYVSKFKVFQSLDARNNLKNKVLSKIFELNQLLEKELPGSDYEQLKAAWYHEKYSLFQCFISPSNIQDIADEIHEQLLRIFVLYIKMPTEEAVIKLHQNHFPLQQEVKGMTRERFNNIINHHSASSEQSNTSLEVEPEKERRKNWTSQDITKLLDAIAVEAKEQSLDDKYYVTTPRTIRNWLNGATTPPPGFSEDVLLSPKSKDKFIGKYIQWQVAKGSSELPANMKKDVAFQPAFHGCSVETSADALLMSEAYQDLSNALSGGNMVVKRRKMRVS